MYGTVERVEWLTPHLVRVLFGGEGWTAWPWRKGWTDASVNLPFVPPEAPYGVPFNVAEPRSLGAPAVADPAPLHGP